MAVPKSVSVQTDFSSGQLDKSAKRGDSDKEVRTGTRQCSNMRLLNTKKLDNRLGRSAKFKSGTRVEEVLMSPGNVFLLDFSAGSLTVRTLAGAAVFTSTKLGDGTTNIPWTANNVNQISWDTLRLAIYLCFPGIVPQVLSWDGVSTWSLTSFVELVIGNQKRTPFYRISAHDITMHPAATIGAGVNCVFSSGILQAGHVGTRMRYVGRQFLITSVTNPTTAVITIEESLPGSQTIAFAGNPAVVFSLNDEIEGNSSGAKGIIVDVNVGLNLLTVQLLGQTASFISSETIVGGSGSLPATTASLLAPPQAMTIWDEEVMNSFRGWPYACFVDQTRLGFCNFPALQNGIAWSAIDSPTDLYADDASSPDNAIFELVPGKAQVLAVVAGAESSEFVFCDNAVHYIPITPTNPLKPGSVGFQRLSGEGCFPFVQPRLMQEVILYVPAGGGTMRAITATGAYQRPYEVRQISELRDDLFNSIVAIAAPGASDPNFPEQYAYILNGDGTLVVAMISVENGQVKDAGWTPWSGVGSVKWVSSRLGTSNVWFATTYPIGPVTIAEFGDQTQYLDATISVNSVPAGLAPPGGKGPLWWYANGTVTLMDQGTRMMGTYQVDANGFIVPQFNGGENLLAATLVAGQPWTVTLEKFVPGVQEGPEGQGGPQRMRKRRVARDAVYVQNSTGFVIQSLRNGVAQAQRRIETWNQDEDPTQPPKLREQAYEFRFKGRDHDPRHVIIKDTPGPLTVLEWTSEVTY